MGALRFLLRRLAFSAALILGVSFILFALINAIGNPIQILLSETPSVSEEMIAALSKYYGLDGNFIDRYGAWLWAILHFDFGTSIIYNQPVGELLLTYGLETLKIQLPAISVAPDRDAVRASSRRCGSTRWADFAIVSSAHARPVAAGLPGRHPADPDLLLLARRAAQLRRLFDAQPAAGQPDLDGLWHMALPVAMLTFFNTATLTLLMRLEHGRRPAGGLHRGRCGKRHARAARHLRPCAAHRLHPDADLSRHADSG